MSPESEGAPAEPGPLLVLSGPAGVGKGTVIRALQQQRPDLVLSVSATTRPPRPGEVDGTHYRFLTRAEFEARIADGDFLEWAEFNGQLYGTPWSSIAAPLKEGRPVILEIEVQGARQVRARQPSAVLVFLRPPSLEALAERLKARGTEDAEAMARRLEIARWELDQADEFDHVVVNDDVDAAARAIARIIDEMPRAQR